LEVIKQCHNEGYREVDFTLGSSSFKARVANYCATLPTVEVYSSLLDFSRSILKKMVADHAKRVLYKITGSEVLWQKIKVRYFEGKHLSDRIRQTPFRRLVSVALSRLWYLVYYRYTG